MRNLKGWGLAAALALGLAAARGMAAGTPFAAAHTLRQTGPFRPANRYGENIVFAGSGTRPGVGVPMVLISGRLAAAKFPRE